MHEYAIQVTRLNRTNFDCLIAPTHDLTSANIGDRGWQFAPLELKYIFSVTHFCNNTKKKHT